jgi:Undecaprenyl-phosphate glucose phosphotransferase
MGASPLEASPFAEPATDLVFESGMAREELARVLAEQPSADPISIIVLAGTWRAVEYTILSLIGAALYKTYVGYDENHVFYFGTVLILGAYTVLAFQSLHAYSLHALRHPRAIMAKLLLAWTTGFLLFLAITFFFKFGSEVSRGFAALWLLIGMAVIVTERMLLARWIDRMVAKGRIVKRAVVVGGGEHGRALIHELRASDIGEVRLLGVFDDRNDSRATSEVEGLPKLGTVDDLLDFARTTRLDLVIFALPITAEERIQNMLRKIWVLPVDIRLAAHAQRIKFRPRSYSYLGRVPVLDLYDRPIADWDVLVKLVFDRVVGALALIALSPILALTALAVKLDSKGPIIFRQIRHGFNNEPIAVYKFRSMFTHSLDPLAAKLVTRDDDRVTRVGRFIRKTSLDELPQLFNVVFAGNLSLVGPRPHALSAKAAEVKYDEAVDGYFARHRVKPGITGWAQVNGWRGETDTEEKIQNRVEHDLYYIEHWSIWLDIYILAKTPFAVLFGKNAF